jgi:hypothetical protein
MTNADKETLRADVSAYMQSTQPDPEPLPLPPAAPANLSPEQRETLFQNWIAHLDKRNPRSFSSREREAYQFAIVRALRTV